MRLQNQTDTACQKPRARAPSFVAIALNLRRLRCESAGTCVLYVPLVKNYRHSLVPTFLVNDYNQTQAQLLSVVVPAMNEADGIGEFHRRMSSVLGALDGLDYEIVYVDDGSTDDTYERLSRLSAEDESVRVLKLSRNFGHQIAISAGLDYARGDAIVVIDSDLQDPPEVIPDMVARWRDGLRRRLRPEVAASR